MSTQNPHWGTPVDAFLEEDDLRETAKAEAVTRVAVWQLAKQSDRQSDSDAVLYARGLVSEMAKTKADPLPSCGSV